MEISYGDMQWNKILPQREYWIMAHKKTSKEMYWPKEILMMME